MIDSKRRPIKSRSNPLIQFLANWLTARAMSANTISVVGMLAAIIAGMFFAFFAQCSIPSVFLILAAVGVQLRLLANVLDGMVAIGSATTSPEGELYNEIPDRISDSVIMMGLGVGVDHFSLGLAAAFVALLTAYMRHVGFGVTAVHQFCGPMAKPHRMALITATALGCACIPNHSGMLIQACLWIIIVLGVCTTLRRLYKISTLLRIRSAL